MLFINIDQSTSIDQKVRRICDTLLDQHIAMSDFIFQLNCEAVSEPVRVQERRSVSWKQRLVLQRTALVLCLSKCFYASFLGDGRIHRCFVNSRIWAGV